MVYVVQKNTGDSFLAAECNQYTNELQNVATDTGQTPSAGDLFQVSRGIAVYSSVGDFYQDSGTTNAYVFSAIAPRKGITDLFTGLRIRGVPNNDNTGTCVVNVQGTGSKSLLDDDGAPLVGGEITAGKEIEFDYDGTAWRLTRETGGLKGGLYPVDKLTLSNNISNPDTHIDFATGKCFDSNRNFIIKNTNGAFNKDMTSNWVEGSGNGGKASAVTFLADNYYYLFGLSKPDGTFDAGLDDNINASNLLTDIASAGYTKWRRIWAIYTLPSSANIRPFIQSNNLCLYVEPISAVADTIQPNVASGTTYYIPTKVPAGITLDVWIEHICIANGGSFLVNIFNSNQTNLQPIAGSPPQQPFGCINGNINFNHHGRLLVSPDSSGQLTWRVNTASIPATYVAFTTLGYIDYRTD